MDELGEQIGGYAALAVGKVGVLVGAGEDLLLLWRLAKKLRAARGARGPPPSRTSSRCT